MSRKGRRPVSKRGGGLLVLLLLAVGWWVFQEWRSGHPADGSLAPGPAEDFVRTPEQARAAAPQVVSVEGGYERHQGARLISHRNNDGDSFHVRLADGRECEIRLYFVDTPESRRKSYGGGQTNDKRISDQARYFGITSGQAVDLGGAAKKRVLGQLAGSPFTVFTKWQPVYRSGRFFALVRLGDGSWLHGQLVREGLARIHTEGAPLPDGTGAAKRESQLGEMEAAAKREGRGGWAR